MLPGTATLMGIVISAVPSLALVTVSVVDVEERNGRISSRAPSCLRSRIIRIGVLTWVLKVGLKGGR